VTSKQVYAVIDEVNDVYGDRKNRNLSNAMLDAVGKASRTSCFGVLSPMT